jgi:hypothetical protein
VVASGHATKLRVNATQCHCVTRSSIWLPIRNDLVDKIVDLVGGEGMPGAVAEAPESFTRDVA